jgi:hypothetical protein
MTRLYKAIVTNFLNAGIRVKDLEADTLRNITAFGIKDCLFEEDCFLLQDFCRGILTLSNNFCHRHPEEYKAVFDKDQKHLHKLFDKLVELVKKIFKKINRKEFDQYFEMLEQQSQALIKMKK